MLKIILSLSWHHPLCHPIYIQPSSLIYVCHCHREKSVQETLLVWYCLRAGNSQNNKQKPYRGDIIAGGEPGCSPCWPQCPLPTCSLSLALDGKWPSGEEGAIVENVAELAKRQTRRHKLCLSSCEEGSGPWAQKSACLGKSWFYDLEHLGLSLCLRFLQYKRELIVLPH